MKPLSQSDHVVGFCIGDGVCSLIVGDVSLLSKGIELLDRRGIRAEGMGEGIDDAVVVICTLGLISGDGECR